MTDYTLTEQSAKKLSRLLNRGKYQPPTFDLERKVRVDDPEGLRYVYPPTGGIPAATYNASTRELTPARAMCNVAEKDSATGKVKPTTETIEVENQVTFVVGTSGKPMTIGFNDTTGVWEVIVADDCQPAPSSGGGSGLGGTFGLLSTVDPISHGTSSQLGMGYGYEGV